MSVHFFPTPYPDELWYSILSRYHMRSGNQCAKHSVIDLFGYHKQKVSVELATDVQRVLAAIPALFLSVDDVLLNHTLLPFYARFWATERKREVMHSLAVGGGNDIHKVGIFQSTSTERRPTFRYCPKCFTEDVRRNGEPYWHRLHQLPDLRVCTEHECWLADTGIPMRNPNKILTPALPDMVLSDTPQEPPTAQELALSALDVECLTCPLDKGNGRVYVDVFDYELKRRGWRTPTGKRTATGKITEAMREFYGTWVYDADIDPARVNVTLAPSKSPAPRYILQAAFFLGITFESLFSKPRTVDTVAEIRRLLAAGISQRETARRVGVDACTVRRWSRPKLA